MFTKKHEEEINLTEMKYYNKTWMSKPYNCVVLAKAGVGCSFKPLFEDEQEKEDLIHDVMIATNWNYEKARSYIEMPEFCFATTSNGSKIAVVRRIIKEGNMDFLDKFGGRSICHFA